MPYCNSIMHVFCQVTFRKRSLPCLTVDIVIGNQVIVDEDSISKFFYIRKKLFVLLGIKIPRNEPLESLYKKAFNLAFNKNCSLAMRKLTVSSSALLKEVIFGKVNGTNRLHTQGRIE